jgi:hypothetical protein
MRKGTSLIMSFVLLLIVSSAYAQSYKYDYHPAYEPPPLKADPQAISRLLSYENFRSIKLLNAAIINFGGGEGEIDKLIDQYAEASALYFQNKMFEAARAFRENQAAIMATAKQLAAKYNQDATVILTDSIKMNVRAKYKLQLGGYRDRTASDKFLEQAQGGVLKANDYYERYKDAKSVSALDLINAIYYYRSAKDNMFQMMRVLADAESKRQAEDEVKAMLAKKELEYSRREVKQQELEMQKKKELLAKYLEKYEKDQVDNKNIIYQTREKKN